MPFMNEMNDHANTAQYSIIGPGAFFHQKVLVAFEFMKRCASPTAGKKKKEKAAGKKVGKDPVLAHLFFPQRPVAQDRCDCRTVCVCSVVIFSGLAVHAPQQRF